MGAITRTAANNFTTSGVILPAAINNTTVASISQLTQVAGKTQTLIQSQTASSSSTISFTTGIDSTYDIYKFEFINLHPATDNVQFRHAASTDGGSNYNLNPILSFFEAENHEGSDGASLGYITGHDNSNNSQTEAKITYNVGADNDQSTAGELWLFGLSDATFTKQFMSTMITSHNADYAKNSYTCGYYNTASDIDAIQFSFSSGNIDAGKIKLYGIQGS